MRKSAATTSKVGKSGNLIAELRKKIEAEPSRPKLLVTEPGVGYRLRE